MDEIAAHWRRDRLFEPKMPRSEAVRLRERWREAVKRSRSWVRAEDGA